MPDYIALFIPFQYLRWPKDRIDKKKSNSNNLFAGVPLAQLEELKVRYPIYKEKIELEIEKRKAARLKTKAKRKAQGTESARPNQTKKPLKRD